MRIGLDFDNTIVRYDALFHRIGCDLADLPADLPPSKVSVRDHLRRIGREEIWTEMQGLVYGPRMGEADLFPGVLEFMDWATRRGDELYIVSHRTQFPFLGPAFDLHQAARRFAHERLIGGGRPLVAEQRIFLELTKAAKLARITELECQVFIDDLPEILLDAAFPSAALGILFDPDGHHPVDGLVREGTWSAIQRRLEG